MKSNKDDNYYIIQGWMMNKLKLKGIQLTVFAIIYCFSQDGASKFTGSLQYLCDFSGVASKNTIINALKELVNKNYIIKENNFINGVKYVSYSINTIVVQNLQQGSANFTMGRCKNYNEGGANFTPNNKEYKKVDNKQDIYCQVIDYLNNKATTNYKWQNKTTQKYISERLNEGFTFDDFKKVIDTKCADWLNDKQMNCYLRPSTLFGDNFENYLNQPIKQCYIKY